MKTFLCGLALLFSLTAFGAVPEYRRNLFDTNSAADAVNANQFDVSGVKLAIKDAARLTNVVHVGEFITTGLNAGSAIFSADVTMEALPGSGRLVAANPSGILYLTNTAEGIIGAGPTVMELRDTAQNIYNYSYGTESAMVWTNAVTGAKAIISATNITVLGTVGGTANPLLHVGTNAINGLTVSSNGFGGFGTNNPVAPLDVVGGMKVNGTGQITGTLTVNGAVNATLFSTFTAGLRVDSGIQVLGNTWLSVENSTNTVFSTSAQFDRMDIRSEGVTRVIVNQAGIGSFSTNYIPVAANTAGATNTTLANEKWNIVGTSGSLIYWHRTGNGGTTPAGVALWTNTVSTAGQDYDVGPNCGIQFDTAVGTVLSRRAW